MASPEQKPVSLAGDENFRVLVETIDDIIVIGDLEGRILYANPATTAVLGYSPQELAGMMVLDLNAASVREEAAVILGEMFQGTRQTCPLPLQHKNGTLVPAETRVWMGRWNGVDCIFGLCKNLTKEQEALQKFDRFFRMNPALMAVNREPDRTFFDVNDAFLRTLGYTADEVIGRSAAEMGLFVDADLHEVLAAELLKSGRFREVELKVRAKDGRVIEGLFSGDLIQSQGHTYFLTVAIDITERQQTVRELRAALAEIRELQGILPICAGCKKIRNDSGYWEQVETYIELHTRAQFSHGMCPDCMVRLYPDFGRKDS